MGNNSSVPATALFTSNPKTEALLFEDAPSRVVLAYRRRSTIGQIAEPRLVVMGGREYRGVK